MEKIPTNLKILLVAMFAVTGLIFAGFFWGAKGIVNFGANINEIIKNNIEETGVSENQGGSASPKSDIDQDGLFDDEEILYRTDPLNRDTDGDGFLDGEEAISGCSPTIPSPDDCSDKIKKSISEKSLTEELSELMAGGLIAGDLKPNNSNFSKSVLSIRNNLLQNSQTLLTIVESEINLNLIKDDSQKSRQEYVNNLSSILEDYLISLSSPEINGDFDGEKLINSYYLKNLNYLKKLDERISQLAVPPSWTEFHKKVLILTKQSENFYQSVLDYKKDPVKSLIALNGIGFLGNEYKNLVSEALRNIKKQNLELPKGDILYLLSGER